MQPNTAATAAHTAVHPAATAVNTVANPTAAAADTAAGTKHNTAAIPTVLL